MAFDFKTLTFIKASDMPVSARFRTSTPKMSISTNGQMRFSKATLTNEHWAGKKKLYVGWDAASRTLGAMPIGDKLPKGILDTELFDIRSSEKHPDNVYVSAAGICKLIGYDYIESGNQAWDIELGAKGEFSLVLPALLTKRPPMRKKKTPASVQAEAGKATKLPATSTDDEDVFA